MRILAIAAVALICGGLAASAQKAPEPAAGHFVPPPDGDGFPRLEAQPGAVSHCRKDAAGEWTCAPLDEAGAAMDDEIAALNRRLAALRAEFDALVRDVARLQRRAGGDVPPPALPPPIPPVLLAPLSEADQADLERALGFMDILMRRFFTMVEEMKGAPEPPDKQ
jgi:hypothetical protein